MKTNRLIVLCLVLLLPILMVAGCGERETTDVTVDTGDGATDQAEMAQLRVIHSSPDAPAVDVYVDGNEAISGLEPGKASDYQEVASGEHTVTVYPAGQQENPVLEQQVDLNAGENYTVVAAGTAANLQPVIAGSKVTEPAEGQAMVQFIHAAADAPAVDVRVPQENMVLFNDVEFKETTDYETVPAGTYNLAVTPAGQQDKTLLRVQDVKLTAGKTYTVVAQGAAGDPPVKVNLYEDK